MRKALQTKVAYVDLNAEKGEGRELVRKYPVRGYPTFIVADANGETITSWAGYQGLQRFVKRISEATDAPLTMTARRARFDAKPNLDDAEVLAEYAAGRHEYDDAEALYLRARALSEGTKSFVGQVAEVRALRFLEQKTGREGLMSALQELVAADEVFQKKADLLLKLSASLGTGDSAVIAPALAALIRDIPSEAGDRTVARLHVAEALHVQGDVEKAIRLYQEGLGAGWETNYDKLNDLAWWCFGHRIALDRAAAWAAKGVDLAPAGAQRAMVLDTLAEIRFAQGDRDQAIRLEERAASEDPTGAEYPGKLAKFRR